MSKSIIPVCALCVDAPSGLSMRAQTGIIDLLANSVKTASWQSCFRVSEAKGIVQFRLMKIECVCMYACMYVRLGEMPH